MVTDLERWEARVRASSTLEPATRQPFEQLIAVSEVTIPEPPKVPAWVRFIIIGILALAAVALAGILAAMPLLVALVSATH